MTLHEKLQESILDIAKLAAAVVGSLYALGFIVVTIHLGRYHVAPYGLVRAQYLLAGLWSLAPFAAITICVVWAASNYFDRTTGPSGMTISKSHVKGIVRVILRGLIVLIATVGGLSALVSIFMKVVPELTVELGVPDFQFIAIYLLKAAAFGIVIVIFGAGAIYAALKMARKIRRTEEIVVAAFSGIVAILAAIVYLFHFALTAYPRIPVVLGGGDGQVVIAVSDKSMSAGTPADQTSQTFASIVGDSPCQLLLETDKAYVLLHLKTHRVVVVNKDKVSMLMFVRGVAN